MDFHSLTRRELQALCKKNKIPANMTNVAMADALQSLEFVDGIEEVLKSCESDVANSSMESPGMSEAVTSAPRTGRRTTQRKTIKHDSETLHTSTRSRCRTRVMVVGDVDEAKKDMHETPALTTTRRRAATTSVRAKLESVMMEVEPKEKIRDQIEEEKKDVPKTPAAALTSQRKEVKAKSSVRQMYSTRRSVRLAGKTMQESSPHENEGTIKFDVFSEETDESLKVDSERYSVHKIEQLEKNGIDLMKSSESLDINNESETVSGQDSNTLVQNEVDMEGLPQDSVNDLVVIALDTKVKEGSEEVARGLNNNGSQVSGEEPIEESEIDAEAKKEKVFQNKSHNMGDDTKRNSDITNMFLTKQLHEQDEPHSGDTSDFVAENDGWEEDKFNQIFECQVGEGAECNSDIAANVDSVAHPLEVAGEEEPMEGYDVDCTEANVDTLADALEVAGEEEPMEESEVDYAEATVETAAHSLPPLASLIPDAAQGAECEVKVSGSQQYLYLHVSEANIEVAGEEPKEESVIDHTEANVDSAAHALPPPASLIPNAAPEPVFTWPLDPTQNPSALASTNPEIITQTNCLTPVKKSSSRTPLENSSAATSIGQILVSDNKENLVCMKENKGTAGNGLQDLSLRKLTKMLKDLQISKDPSGKEVAKLKAASSRSALLTLPENRLINETQN